MSTETLAVELEAWMERNDKSLADIESATKVSISTVRRFLKRETTLNRANKDRLEQLIKGAPGQGTPQNVA